ncbi:MAG: nucleotidyltransferase family protein [Pseudomonas sp.]
MPRVWLYGSRLDDARRGGDVDLLIRSTPPISLLQRARIKSELEQKLGMPVDILATPAAGVTSPFATIAQAHSKLL